MTGSRMLTVSQVARHAGISRSTVLYYESLGLLRASRLGGNRYRLYDSRGLQTIEEIRRYRLLGIPLASIARVLRDPAAAATRVLTARLEAVEKDIETLKAHAATIRKLLSGKQEWRKSVPMTKQKWIEIMKAAGFTEDAMRSWHQEFEASAPEQHEQFLRYLHVADAEVDAIRRMSRQK